MDDCDRWGNGDRKSRIGIRVWLMCDVWMDEARDMRGKTGRRRYLIMYQDVFLSFTHGSCCVALHLGCCMHACIQYFLFLHSVRVVVIVDLLSFDACILMRGRMDK